MLVSIITVYYNREDRVIDSIQSLLNQTYEDIEIIAIDDGSTDNTLKALKSFKDPRLKVLTHSNRGFVRSIIKAVDLSKGEIIAIHGSGDYSYPTRIEKQLSYINTEVGIVGCLVENINTVTNRTQLHSPKVHVSNMTEQLLKENVFTHGEVMFRKDIYNAVGGYREYFKYSQDYDLWLRMSMVTTFSAVNEILYKRYTFEDGVNGSFKKRVQQKYLVELSRQCIKMRLTNGKDLIDGYGNYAPFFQKNSKRLSMEFIRLSINALTIGDYKNAEYIIIQSKKEHKNLLNLILHSLIIFTGYFKYTRERIPKILRFITDLKNKLL